MDIWHIRGARRLEGRCRVQGSKNATLPILAAAIVAPLRCELYGVPRLRDVEAALRILRHLGCRVECSGGCVAIDSTTLSCSGVPHELMAEMRSSVLFLGALIARCGEARLTLPGGCKLGKRPVDLHLAALRQLGAPIEEEGEELCCRGACLRGAEIALPFPSVGATENALLAACRARGASVIRGAAREPEITALAQFLNAAGARIGGIGTDTLYIDGFCARGTVQRRMAPDRIAAATYACAVAGCGGEIELTGFDPGEISAVVYFLNEAGCDIIHRTNGLTLRSSGRLRGVGSVCTAPYPGFPTDAQPLLMAALLRAEGTTRIRETIFENRFRQVPELCRLGADIRLDADTAEIRGVASLHGAALHATDLRGGAAMICAALSAEGESVVLDEGHIRRGYEEFDGSLRALGADIVLEH